jgi:hypothetical protein
LASSIDGDESLLPNLIAWYAFYLYSVFSAYLAKAFFPAATRAFSTLPAFLRLASACVRSVVGYSITTMPIGNALSGASL